MLIYRIETDDNYKITIKNKNSEVRVAEKQIYAKNKKYL